jgi:hypothetical protein
MFCNKAKPYKPRVILEVFLCPFLRYLGAYIWETLPKLNAYPLLLSKKS